MKNKVLILGVLAVLAAGWIWYFVYGPGRSPALLGGDKDEHGCTGSAGYSWCEPKQACARPWETSCAAADSYKNAEYVVEGKKVQLVNGIAEAEAAPGSASKLTTKYFGNEADGDLNGDGKDDKAFILTQSGGGSGNFYYAAAAIRTADGWSGTNAILLGDRVAPQPTQITNGAAIFNYADRKPGDPMTTPPSVGISKYLHMSGAVLVEGGGE